MVFLNGKFLPIEQAMVPVLDRGFIFGDGVYELIPVYSRAPFRMDDHLARLERSLAAVRIKNPYTRERWREIILQLVAQQPWEDQAVYFQVTRGVAKRDHAFPASVEPTVFVMCNPLVNPPRELVEKGAAAVSAPDNRWLRCDIKSISLIGNCLLRQVSADAGAQETILFRDGKLTEASASNVFVVKRGVISRRPRPISSFGHHLRRNHRARAQRPAARVRDIPEATYAAGDLESLLVRKCSLIVARQQSVGDPAARDFRHVPALQGSSEGDARESAKAVICLARLAFPATFRSR
jgi:D-amino acid aminotransferase